MEGRKRGNEANENGIGPIKRPAKNGHERGTGALIDASTKHDWLGRVTSTTDQRGVTHTYTYDSAGRLAADTVSNFGNLPVAAQMVNEIATTYDRHNSGDNSGDTTIPGTIPGTQYRIMTQRHELGTMSPELHTKGGIEMEREIPRAALFAALMVAS